MGARKPLHLHYREQPDRNILTWVEESTGTDSGSLLSETFTCRFLVCRQFISDSGPKPKEGKEKPSHKARTQRKRNDGIRIWGLNK